MINAFSGGADVAMIASADGPGTRPRGEYSKTQFARRELHRALARADRARVALELVGSLIDILEVRSENPLHVFVQDLTRLRGVKLRVADNGEKSPVVDQNVRAFLER